MLSCLFCVLQGWWQVCTAMPLELSKNIFSLTMRLRFFPHGATATRGPGLPYYPGFTITLRHTAFDRTPLDGSSARWRDLYLTTHNTPKGHTSMLPAEFAPVIPASERSQTHALDRAANGKGPTMWLYLLIFLLQNYIETMEVCRVAEYHVMEANRAIPLQAWTGPCGCRRAPRLSIQFGT
jgi:hypothetical protein